jgi:2,4-didehydro-3-deoxy-L-rhamnonate hydrolase
MRLCRFLHLDRPRCGLYFDEYVLPLDDLASAAGEKSIADIVQTGEFERLLPLDSAAWLAVIDLVNEVLGNLNTSDNFRLPSSSVSLLPPIARPNKLLMLAGNYAAHIEEQGGVAAERERTFPYVFMKPASTTLVGDSAEVHIPSVSPDKIDHEIELAFVMGKRTRNVTADQALECVAGYTIINDISDRGFRPNPLRENRPKDQFFDWLHGKWHDGFCPCGPCMVTTDEIQNPQQLELELRVDGELRQHGTTADQVFSVAEVIAFLSQWVTLEPGDIVSTGTPAGVGNASGKYLRAGQKVVARIPGIGELISYMR